MPGSPLRDSVKWPPAVRAGGPPRTQRQEPKWESEWASGERDVWKAHDGWALGFSRSSGGGQHVAASPAGVDEVIDDQTVLGDLLRLLDQEEEHRRRRTGTNRQAGPPGADQDAWGDESLGLGAWSDFMLVVDGFVELDEKPIFRSGGFGAAV